MKKLLFIFSCLFFSQIGSSQITYRFTGNGYWSAAFNWAGALLPPSVLPAGDTIVISPGIGDSCVLDVMQTIAPGASLVLAPGANFIIRNGGITGVLPVVSTSLVTNISTDSATCGGMISGGTITGYGLVWDTLPGPVITLDTKTLNNDTARQFTNSMSGLRPGVKYYVRAFATGPAGTAYGNEVSFETLPEIVTSSLHIISATSVSCAGIITGSYLVCGLVWDTMPSPPVTLFTKTYHAPLGDHFRDTITGLIPLKTYYLRSYVVNNSGVSYGNEIIFTTVGLPQVYTDTVKSVTSTSFICGGIANGIAITESGLVWDTLPGPTITQGNKVPNRVISDTFSNRISGLQIGKTYYVRAYASSVAGTGYGGERQFTVPALYLSNDSSFTDPRDGKVYRFRHIGSQVWMTENLRYVPSNGSICYNLNNANCNEYGYLYKWSAALAVVPPGWHIPSEAEWQLLVDNLGGDSSAGGKMKEAGTSHWRSPNTGADNSSGFTGLPAGRCESYNVVFNGLTTAAYWWTSTPSYSNYANMRALNYSDSIAARYIADRNDWIAVRCVRDQ